jgi:hypothetical protein
VPTVFLSHAAADKPLIDDLKQMIQSAVGVAPGEFFYSSGKGTGIPPGQNFVEFIRDEMEGATFVITVITPAFRESEFCLAELGAVWLAADKEFFPLCTPREDDRSGQSPLVSETGGRASATACRSERDRASDAQQLLLVRSGHGW